MELDKDVVQSLVLKTGDMSCEPSYVVGEVQKAVVADTLGIAVEEVGLWRREGSASALGEGRDGDSP